ncbi:MAG: protein phosphatase 2C domain-containing protein [Paludisphaera borealis]|uniref:PP2C family protein-serine/threonine phosphatase n=1 Tax=Paludisphaera borealis TaxID=1387353 RepID=UPI00283D229F|nr:protein phosphatase 2C domain-containing protein [Paludisphaera borealis]MDR3622306.1 protein phosphatase 2C domain-containing protein [Paludisphaera borealis]
MNWDDIIIDASASDTGMRRQNNQDSHTTVRAPNREAWRNRGHLFMVADGMGAHAVGELASKMACDLIPHSYMKAKNGTAVEAIAKAFRDVSAQIHGRAAANRDFQGMGTTCSSLLLLPEGALVAHVGDSRVYRVRDRRIDQLSFDHSLVWELVRRNHLTPEQANHSIPKNVITRSLGPEVDIEVDVEGPLAVKIGDVFLLCSDGLSGPVTDPELGAFAGHFHPRDACRYLVSLANLRGGYDNITVLVVRIGPWVDPESGETSHQDLAASHAEHQHSRNGRTKVSWKNRILDRLTAPKPPQALAPDEEHRYRSCESGIDEALLDDLSQLVDNARETAIAQAWSVDWTELSVHRKKMTEARAARNIWVTLREIGELISLLGQAGRFHRRSGGS